MAKMNYSCPLFIFLFEGISNLVILESGTYTRIIYDILRIGTKI